ncbi:MAG TPA: hypothetical protein VE990_03410 [Acidimicrobiales bacterium]|nr:hypothetical protein [Acidimicrobiales bacterium]
MSGCRAVLRLLVTLGLLAVGLCVNPIPANASAGGSHTWGGSIVISPSTAVAGSTGNNLAFLYTAPAGADFNGVVTVVVPTSSRPPLNTTGYSPVPASNNVVVQTSTCKMASVSSFSTATPAYPGDQPGTQISIRANCKGGTQFRMTYGPVTVPQAPQTYTFYATAGTALALQPTQTVIPGPAFRLTVAASTSSTTAGTAFSVQVRALDAYNNVATSYAGTIHFTSTDTQASLPADYAFQGTDHGIHTFAAGAMLKTAGSQTISGADTVNPLAGSTPPISVAPAPASHFDLSAPATTNAGDAVSVTVTALDPYGNTATSYAQTITFTSSDNQASLPPDYTFDPSTDAGVHAFTNAAVLRSSGSQTISATDTADPTVTGTTAGTTVAPGPATQMSVVILGGANAGQRIMAVHVRALDAYGNQASGYAGTVHFSSTDPQATLAGDYTFQPGDGGGKVFSNTFILRTAGNQTITATDTVDASITGTSDPALVRPSSATHLSISAPASAATGVPFSLTVTALDAYGNVASGYGGTVTFTSSDAQATLPPDYTFDPTTDAGVHTFQGGATLITPGPQTITASDTANSAVFGTATIDVF